MNCFVTQGPTARYLYSVLVGSFLTAYMFKEEVIHIILMSAGSYALMTWMPRKSQHIYVIAYVTLYLSLHHLYVMYTDFGGYRCDSRCYIMPLMQKLWSLAFAYKDGYEQPTSLSKEQVAKRVVHQPTILQFFSYAFFCCGCITGPFIEYKDFTDLMEFSGNYKTLPRGPK
jgi:lysophospholipid acyltransferase